MRIKLIPENDEERAKYAGKDEVVHNGVREFMIFGNKIDGDGDLLDFHEWTGQARYLLGSLQYFYESINDERREQRDAELQRRMMRVHQAPTQFGNVSGGMVKRGAVKDPNVQPIDVSQFNAANADELGGNTVPFRILKEEEDHFVVDEDVGRDVVEDDVFGEEEYVDQNVNIDVEEISRQAKRKE